MNYNKKELNDILSSIIRNRLEHESICGISYDSNFSEIGVDSILFVTIIIDIEDELKFSFSNDIPVMSDCKTINGLIKKIIMLIDKTNDIQ